MKAFGRKSRLTVGTLALDNLDIAFKVEKHLKPEPNHIDISVFNLNADHRAQIGSWKSTDDPDDKSIVVRLDAGYEENIFQLFLGDLRNGFTIKDGNDYITTFSAGDGEHGYKKSRINTSFGPHVSADTALTAIVNALGVGQGNVAQVVSKLRLTGAANMFIGGGALSGSAARHMTDFCQSANLEWSIQDGAIQILDKGAALNTKAVFLSSDTGLVDSPKIDRKGKLTGTSLIQENLKPGVLIEVDAETVSGFFRVEKIEYEGATRDTEWYVNFEASAVKLA